MKLIFGVHPFNPDKPLLGTFKMKLELPKGCGVDFAEKEIEKAVQQIKALSLEIFKADTEGRKIDPAILDQP